MALYAGVGPTEGASYVEGLAVHGLVVGRAACILYCDPGSGMSKPPLGGVPRPWRLIRDATDHLLEMTWEPASGRSLVRSVTVPCVQKGNEPIPSSNRLRMRAGKLYKWTCEVEGMESDRQDWGRWARGACSR